MSFGRSLFISSSKSLVHNSSIIHVVQLITCRSFEWFSSFSLLPVIRLQFMVHAGRLVHPVVQLLIQLVR